MEFNEFIQNSMSFELIQWKVVDFNGIKLNPMEAYGI